MFIKFVLYRLFEVSLKKMLVIMWVQKKKSRGWVIEIVEFYDFLAISYLELEKRLFKINFITLVAYNW